jgi:hypothetical protein
MLARIFTIGSRRAVAGADRLHRSGPARSQARSGSSSREDVAARGRQERCGAARIRGAASLEGMAGLWRAGEADSSLWPAASRSACTALTCGTAGAGNVTGTRGSASCGVRLKSSSRRAACVAGLARL